MPGAARTVVFEEPGRLTVRELDLRAATANDVVIECDWSGVSTGTERLLWSGRMPPFPGLSYPLIPGYETVGTIVRAGSSSGRSEGEQVFVPGARSHAGAASLFGATSATLVAPGSAVHRIPDGLGPDATLIALAATAHHCLAASPDRAPDLIVGHGVLGRLLARIVIALGHAAPVVWERDAARSAATDGYAVVAPSDDDRHDYRCIVDVSGDNAILDTLVARTARGGEIVLAGFYGAPLSFAFPPAFMRETTIRISAEFKPEDVRAVIDLVERNALSLAGLVTNSADATDARNAYATAFGDPACLKMVLNWRNAR